MENSFTNLYKTYSPSQLLEIINKKEDYQPLAIEAAEKELSIRQLTTEQLVDATKELEDKEIQKKEKIKKQKAFETSIKRHGERFVANFNPEANPTIDKKIRFICLSLILILAYSIISEYKSIIQDIKDEGILNAYILLLLAPYIFVPIGVYYFWHKKKFGWSIISIWLVYVVVSIIFSYIQELRFTREFSFLFFEKHGVVYYLTQILIYGGLLVYINLPVIKQEMKVDKRRQTMILASATVIFIIILLGLS